jgi:hypothetical protein
MTAPPPALVTQRNCEAHLGYSRRVFLERVREYAASGGAVVADGKLRGVEPEVFVAWLRRRGERLRAQQLSQPEPTPLERELGLVRVRRT